MKFVGAYTRAQLIRSALPRNALLAEQKTLKNSQTSTGGLGKGKKHERYQT